MMNALEIINSRHELFAAFTKVSQPRSNYQIEKFVVGEHLTPERQYMQAVLELQRKTSAIRRAVIELKKLNARLLSESDEIERELIQVDIDDINFAIEGAAREFNTLHSIYKRYPEYTVEQLQDAEESYWIKRLATQAQIDLEATGAIGVGNLDALRQAGLIGGFEVRFGKTLSGIDEAIAIGERG